MSRVSPALIIRFLFNAPQDVCNISGSAPSIFHGTFVSIALVSILSLDERILSLTTVNFRPQKHPYKLRRHGQSELPTGCFVDEANSFDAKDTWQFDIWRLSQLSKELRAIEGKALTWIRTWPLLAFEVGLCSAFKDSKAPDVCRTTAFIVSLAILRTMNAKEAVPRNGGARKCSSILLKILR
jgi:hypothetical protein